MTLTGGPCAVVRQIAQDQYWHNNDGKELRAHCQPQSRGEDEDSLRVAPAHIGVKGEESQENGQRAEGIEQINEALRLRPDYQEAKRRLEEVNSTAA